jgi:hypothetical protein
MQIKIEVIEGFKPWRLWFQSKSRESKVGQSHHKIRTRVSRDIFQYFEEFQIATLQLSEINIQSKREQRGKAVYFVLRSALISWFSVRSAGVIPSLHNQLSKRRCSCTFHILFRSFLDEERDNISMPCLSRKMERGKAVRRIPIRWIR